ncbi:MAG: PAS domain S-box protein [Candidatus Acidiferrales bacterium]
MNTRSRLFFLIGIMAVVSLAATGSALYAAYRGSIADMKQRLSKSAQSQARLVEVLINEQPLEPEKALPLIEEAHEQVFTSQQTAELLLVRLKGDQMEFLTAHRSGQHLRLPPVPLNGRLAEACRRGVSGESGVMIGLDYRGQTVIAAYEPVRQTGWAVISKVDLEEVQAPFLRTALFGVLLNLGVVLLAAVLFVRFADPLYQRLEESQQRFRALFNQSFQLLWTLKTDGTIAEINGTALDVAGVIVTAALGKPFWQTRWWPEDGTLRDQLQVAVREAAEGSFVRMEVEARGFGGRHLTLDLSFKPVTDRRGQVVLLSVEGHDITERKQAERKLAERTAYLNALIENSPLGIVAHDSEGRVKMCNPAFERLFGHGSENIVGKPLDDLISPRDRPTEAEEITRQVVAGQVMRLRTQRRRSDGTLVDVEIHGVPLAIGGESAGGYGLYEDITERLRAETEISERTAFLNALIENSPLAIVTIDPEERVQHCNPTFERLFGYRLDEMKGKRIDDFVAPGDLSNEALNLTRQAVRGEIGHAVTHRQRKDGAVIQVEVHGVPLVVNGKLVGGYALYQDVTERRRAEEERENLLRELQEALANIKTLSGLLPICASCKKVRDDGGYWSQIESYISAHSDAQFSHGICPECAKQLYPEHYHKMFPELHEDKKAGE